VLVLLHAAPAPAAELFGTIVAVADGDTVTLLDDTHRQHRVRLSAIDAPERRQPYGERAKQHLASLVYGKTVLVVWEKRDRYRRIVGRVLVPQCTQSQCGYTIDAGLEQIKAGLAWHYKQYAIEQPPAERTRYAALELQARERGEGLWRDPYPVPPWQFRHAGRAAHAAISRTSPSVFPRRTAPTLVLHPSATMDPHQTTKRQV
jgi:endonuclease YncB( thermonuclease family)